MSAIFQDENDKSGHLAKLYLRDTRMQAFMYRAGGQWGEKLIEIDFNLHKTIFGLFQDLRSCVRRLELIATSRLHFTWEQFCHSHALEQSLVMEFGGI